MYLSVTPLINLMPASFKNYFKKNTGLFNFENRKIF